MFVAFDLYSQFVISNLSSVRPFSKNTRVINFNILVITFRVFLFNSLMQMVFGKTHLSELFD